MKRDLRLKNETIQQKEIDISCLKGQVKIAFDTMDDIETDEEGEVDAEDSDTLTNIEPISEEDILLEDLLDLDYNELPKDPNVSCFKKDKF